MHSLDARLKVLEAATKPEEAASAHRMFDWCQSRGLEVPPVGDLTVTEWLENVPRAVLRTRLESHDREKQNAKP